MYSLIFCLDLETNTLFYFYILEVIRFYCCYYILEGLLLCLLKYCETKKKSELRKVKVELIHVILKSTLIVHSMRDQTTEYKVQNQAHIYL